MKNKKLKLGIDLDDTLWKFHKKFFEYYNFVKGTNYSEQDYVKYSLDSFLGITPEEVSKFIESFYFSVFENDLELMEGSKEVILKLSEKYEIYFLTARHLGIKEITLQKLNKIFPKNFPVFFIFDKNKKLIQEKLDYCLEKGIKILIDDRPKTVKMCAKKGIKCLLMNQKWNEQMILEEGIERVNNWQEVFDKLKEVEHGF